MNPALEKLQDPRDYFKGRGVARLPVPMNVLLFLRKTVRALQQEALQNRSHHRFVLIFNYETEGSVHLDNSVFRLRPGQALLVMPYQFHHFSRLASKNLKWLFCTFELSDGSFTEPLRNRVVNLGEQTAGAVDDVLGEWVGPSRSLTGELLQAGLLRVLLSLCRDRIPLTRRSSREPSDKLLRSINKLLLSWRGRTVVVADLADALDLSESSLRFHFRSAAGVSLGGYVQNFRINRAMELLRTTTLPISDIAYEAGFGSPQAFSRIFKKKSGCTPREYRKN